MGFEVRWAARAAWPAWLTRPAGAPPAGRVARWSGWLAVVGIGGSLAVTIAVSLARASWMEPVVPMPKHGPPFELGSWHLTLASVTAALWLSAVAGGLGIAAGLLAVRRGARPPVWLLLAAAAVVVAVLTLLPPVGSTDSLDYMAFGRMAVLGHSPYVMVPRQLAYLHDAVRKSIPWEWGNIPSTYGPAATVEQYVAARLGGTSVARIVFWLKLANALAFGTVAYVADRLLRSNPAGRLRAHLLWTINPLLIWQLIAAAHLDVLAAAAGMLGLVVAGGWPARQPGRGDEHLGRVLAGGMLVGLAADIKITFVLFGLGLAWAYRRSLAACAVAACGMLAVLLPTYAWFGPPAIKALTTRANRTTADNFYQLFGTSHSFLFHHLNVIAAVIVAGLAIVTLTRLPIRAAAQPAIFGALALSTAWLFVWQYQLPSYEAMIICLLILVPACWLDWLVVARLTAATVALMPGNTVAPPTPTLARISYDDLTVAVPIVLTCAAAALVVLCFARGERRVRAVRPLPPGPAAAVPLATDPGPLAASGTHLTGEPGAPRGVPPGG